MWCNMYFIHQILVNKVVFRSPVYFVVFITYMYYSWLIYADLTVFYFLQAKNSVSPKKLECPLENCWPGQNVPQKWYPRSDTGHLSHIGIHMMYACYRWCTNSVTLVCSVCRPLKNYSIFYKQQCSVLGPCLSGVKCCIALSNFWFIFVSKEASDDQTRSLLVDNESQTADRAQVETLLKEKDHNHRSMSHLRGVHS